MKWDEIWNSKFSIENSFFIFQKNVHYFDRFRVEFHKSSESYDNTMWICGKQHVGWNPSSNMFYDGLNLDWFSRCHLLINDWQNDNGNKFYIEQKHFFFAYIRLDETFSALSVIHAVNCSIKALSKTNFRNLNRFNALYLRWNQIEKIASDTFQDLVSLKHLGLGKTCEIAIFFWWNCTQTDLLIVF